MEYKKNKIQCDKYNVVKPSEKTILYPPIKPIFICRGECLKCIDKNCLTI